MNKEGGREVEEGRGCSPFCSKPPPPAAAGSLAVPPGDLAPGHHASVLWQLIVSTTREKSWCCQCLLMFSTRDRAGVAGACPSMHSKELNKKEWASSPEAIQAPSISFGTSASKRMLIVSFWSRVVSYLHGPAAGTPRNPLAAWH